MKRVVVLVIGLAMLCGCGAVVEAPEVQYTATQPAFTTIPSPPENKSGNYEERFPLYLSLPEDDIYLYGIEGGNFERGVVLFQENCESYFGSWGGSSWRGYNEMIYHDFDGDGKKDIGVILYQASGTGLYLSDLHIVSSEKIQVGVTASYMGDPIYQFKHTDHVFTHEDVSAFFNERLTAKRGKQKNTVEFTIGKKTWTADLEPDETWNAGEGVLVGTHIEFEFEGTSIRLRAAPYVIYEERALPGWLLGGFTADVTFDGKEFHLTNIDYEPDQEN